MLRKFGVLVFLAGATVAVVESTNIKVVRQLNPDTNFPPVADSFSNRQCSSSSCPSSRSICAGGGCCMCKCLYDWPNVFVNRTSARCMSYGEMNRMSSANCQYSFRRSTEPLEVIPLTEEATGRIRFREGSVRVNCAENGLPVDKWQFLDVDGRWQDGEGNVFTVNFTIVGGPDGNKKDLTFLNWNARLDSKYAGLIIKFSLMCGSSRNLGCILAKINGTHTYTLPQSTTSVPAPASTSQQPSTGTPSTLVPEDTPSSSPTSEPESTGAPTTAVTTTEPDAGQATGGTPPGVTGSKSSSRGKPPPTKSADQQQASNSAQNVSSTPIGPILGVIGGLICLICLVCLVVVALYKRRKRRLERPGKHPADAGSGTNLKDNQDPVYAELPDNTETAGEFDNPVYCDATEEQFKRRSKQDPLPALPVDESTYQSLDQNTRTVTGTSVSSPLENAKQEGDYLNPEREESDTIDYDNPPVSSQVPIKHDSSDYDNPPVGSSSPPTNTPRLEKLNNELSDYDNPPVQGNNTCPPTNTSSDYDNPPVQDTPQGVAAESVPESTEDTTEPEYFVLEPEDSSL